MTIGRKILRVCLGITLPFGVWGASAEALDSLDLSCRDSLLVDYVAVDSVRPLYPQTVDSLRLDIAGPPKKRPWLSGVEVVGTNLLFHVITRYIIHEDYAQITWSSIKNNFKTGFLWDNDKFNTNLYRTAEQNPFLGLRGIRLGLHERRDLLETQLRALLRAGIYGNLRVMLPMVSSVQEVQDV